MITPAVQADRQKICRACEFWRGRCIKHHIITSSAGCPVGKFPSLSPKDHGQTATVAAGCVRNDCHGANKEIAPLTYVEAFLKLRQAMVVWLATGAKTTNHQEYTRRLNICGACPHYKWFQCAQCKCLMFVKAKLATSRCPIGKF